ncbi:MAG: MFS transporter [Mycobacterium sp.]|uniref:MFS transporter n=1 Tax=Mycobacterium sp. TaxID=1785 RepID=UPI002639C2ED|nr:MFS transporter [Mycobacterium sp.]MDI3313390.1 MFS transporter [Mycobacterium sp.]
MTTTHLAASQPDTGLEAIDRAGISRFQWKIMFVSGMGFFTDAYDLFVIGIVVYLVKPEWHLSTDHVAWLNSATLLASALGAIIFGRVADILGRKRIYGYEVLILAAGAIASAFSPNFIWLLVCRAILGIGIGGDYPVSATIMSEYSGKQNRGRMIGLVFAMQGAGLIVGPLIAAVLLAAHLPAGITWRVLLALGAIPGLAVFYLRRQIHETPRFALAGGATREAKAAIAAATGKAVAAPAPADTVIRLPHGALDGFAVLFRSPRMLKWLIGTSAAWALMDFCYYGNSISTPEILSLINRHGTELDNVLIQLAIFAVFALPGYVLAILLLDRSGRRSIQTLGFGVMGLMFLAIGLIPAVTVTVVPFVLLFGVSYFFTQFGPNTTTFVYPAEIFPVEVRTTGHGISAAAGKLGAFVGAFLFPVFIATSMGIKGALVIAGIVAIAGMAATVALLPEPKGRSLEELEEEAHALAPREVVWEAVA